MRNLIFWQVSSEPVELIECPITAETKPHSCIKYWSHICDKSADQQTNVLRNKATMYHVSTLMSLPSNIKLS